MHARDPHTHWDKTNKDNYHKLASPLAIFRHFCHFHQNPHSPSGIQFESPAVWRFSPLSPLHAYLDISEIGNPPVHIISHFNLITFTRYVGWTAKHVTPPIWGPPHHHVNRPLGTDMSTSPNFLKRKEWVHHLLLTLSSPVDGFIIFFSASRIWHT